MLSDLFLLVPAVVVLAVLVFLSRRRRARVDHTDADIRLPKNTIVVDGSNVIHWGGKPSIKVLQKVLSVVEAQGRSPIVYFDASVGYQIADRYLDDRALSQMTGVPKDRICIVDKGVVADEMILAFATKHRLRIVTNDRYRDWRSRFPHAARKGMLVSGKWRSGNPTLRL